MNLLLWFAKDAMNTKADNRKVLKRYSASMEALLKNGYQTSKRPSGHDISGNFSKRQKGAIPANLLGSTDNPDAQGEPFEHMFQSLLAMSNTASNDRYLKVCKETGLKPHPARFPLGLPAFFIEFLSEPGDLVLDPFGGSGTTAEAAETLNRRWVTCDVNDQYVRTSGSRFDNAEIRFQ